MSSQGDGQVAEYKVSYSGQLKNQIKTLHAQQASKGKGTEFLDALRTIFHRLRKDPRELGDPLYRLPILKLLVYHAIAPPLLVYYAVHDEKRVVFIRDITLLA